MVAMLAAVREHWGGWDAFVADIGVQPEVVDRVRAALLEPRP